MEEEEVEVEEEVEDNDDDWLIGCISKLGMFWFWLVDFWSVWIVCEGVESGVGICEVWGGGGGGGGEVG